MTETQTTAASPAQEKEDWFLTQLEARPLAVDQLLEFLETSATGAAPEQTREWTDLLFEAAIEAGVARDAVRVLSCRVASAGEDAPSPVECKADALRALEANREKAGVVDEVGFDDGLPVTESLRRLQALADLERGCLCYDKTWGFGVVQSVDYFYKQVTIDFENKSDHQMSFAYAAEVLALIGDDHLMARRHNEPEEIERLVREAPAEIVRMALKSYGKMSVPILQETLVPSLVPELDWKKFWDAARKELKKDPLIDIPAKRTAPIRILAKEKAYDEEWFEKLLRQRDVLHLLKEVEKLAADPDGKAAVALHGAAVVDRLAFVIKAADPKFPGQIARAIMAACDLGITDERLRIEERTETFLDAECFRDATGQLPARFVPVFITFLLAHDEARTLALLEELLPRLDLSTLSVVVDVLTSKGRQESCARIMRQLIADQEAEVEIMAWVLRNPEKAAAWKVGSLPDIAYQALAQIEEDYMGERLRSQNQLRERFSRKDWFIPALEAMNEGQRFDFAGRLKDTPGFTSIDRRSLLGKAIKRFKNLQSVTASRHAAKKDRAPRLTSTRSYRTRQLQLEKLVNVDIPANSQEIALARSYGDLSENHEYKAAKEMQGILMKRQADIEQMLNEVRPSDFRNMPADVVGLATVVEVEYEGGTRERYHILGEWDRDEELHIISSTTRMAKALAGARAGDNVSVPSEDGQKQCRLVSVGPLPESILAWIDSEDPAP